MGTELVPSIITVWMPVFARHVPKRSPILLSPNNMVSGLLPEIEVRDAQMAPVATHEPAEIINGSVNFLVDPFWFFVIEEANNSMLSALPPGNRKKISENC